MGRLVHPAWCGTVDEPFSRDPIWRGQTLAHVGVGLRASQANQQGDTCGVGVEGRTVGEAARRRGGDTPISTAPSRVLRHVGVTAGKPVYPLPAGGVVIPWRLPSSSGAASPTRPSPTLPSCCPIPRAGSPFSSSARRSMTQTAQPSDPFRARVPIHRNGSEGGREELPTHGLRKLGVPRPQAGQRAQATLPPLRCLPVVAAAVLDNRSVREGASVAVLRGQGGRRK